MDTNSGQKLVGGSKPEATLSMRDVLALPALSGARLVAGAAGLARPVSWSHVVDMPDPAPWVPAGYFLLTTGYSWPQAPRDQIALIEALAAGGIAGVGLACPKYRDGFSEAERAAADRHGIALIEIPWDIQFARITQELHRALMAEPYRIIERSEQIHRALMRAASREATLDDLAHILYPLIGRSITFEDPHGKLLAHCSMEGAADPIRRITLQNAQAPPSMLRALEATGLDRRIKASDKPVRVSAMPEIGLTARVACPIRLGNELVGIVWIIEGDEPLSELDHRAAEYAALVAAIRIAHQRELATLESSLGHASVLALLESDPGQSPSAEERVRLLGFDTQKPYRVGIVMLPEELPLAREGFLRRDRVATRVRDALAQLGVEQLVTVMLNRVPFFVPEGIAPEAVLRALGDAALSMVVGRAHCGVEGVRRSYREALALLSYPKRESFCVYDDVLLPRVLTGDREARAAFLDSMVTPLLCRRNGDVLMRALMELGRKGFRMGETAEALGVHINTLRYRLTRAADILQIDLDDPEVRFRLQLASHIAEVTEMPELYPANSP